MNITDFLLTGIGKLLTIAAILVGFAVYYYVVVPSFDALRRIIKTGKALSWAEQKEVLIGIGIELGKMVFIPVLVLTALLTSMQISLPAVHDISGFLAGVIEDLAIELSGEIDTTYSDRLRENDPYDSGGGYPTPVLLPTAQIIVVTSTPAPIIPTVPIRQPDILTTPTRVRTFP